MSPSLRTTLRILAASATLAVLTGCFEFKERLTLAKDNSGRYGLSVGVDLAPAIDMLSFGGDRKTTLDGLMNSTEDLQDAVQEPEQIASGLTWIGGNAGVEGEVLVLGMELGFDALDALAQPMSPDATSSVLRVPVTTKKKLITFEGPLYGGLADALESAEDDLGVLKMLSGGARFVFEIDAPYHKVKQHDADERDGSILRWSHTLDEMATGTVSATLKGAKPRK